MNLVKTLQSLFLYFFQTKQEVLVLQKELFLSGKKDVMKEFSQKYFHLYVKARLLHEAKNLAPFISIA